MPKPENPQTLNRYSYTLNNPLKYVDPTGNFVMFIGGWGTTNTFDNRWSTWGSLINRMGLKHGDYGFFDWSSGWTGEGTPSAERRVDEAAAELARQLSGKTNITLIGHSKGGALIMEYLAQIAEGKLEANVQVAAAYTIDSPLDFGAADARWVGANRRQGGVDRYANLHSRLLQQGLTVTLTGFDNPEDWPVTSYDPIPGVNYVRLPVPPNVQWPWQYWETAHGLLLSDPRVAAYIMGGPDM